MQQKPNDLFIDQIRDQLRDNPTAKVHMQQEGISEALQEAFEERAAIREYDGQQSREEAEKGAREDLGL